MALWCVRNKAGNGSQTLMGIGSPVLPSLAGNVPGVDDASLARMREGGLRHGKMFCYSRNRSVL